MKIFNNYTDNLFILFEKAKKEDINLQVIFHYLNEETINSNDHDFLPSIIMICIFLEFKL